MDCLGVISVFIFRLVIYIYTYLTLPLYYIIQKPWQKREDLNRPPPFIQYDQGDGYLIVNNQMKISNFRKQLAQDAKIDTLVKGFEYATKRYVGKKVLGTREMLAEETEVQTNGSVFTKYVQGEYIWRTYEQMHEQVMFFGCGLRSLGFVNKQNVVLFSETRAEWLIAAFGCMTQSLPVVTLYANLNDEALVHGIVETEASCIITSHELLSRVLNILPQANSVKTIIVFENPMKLMDPETFGKTLSIHPFRRVIEMGKFGNYECSLPTPEDTAIIMYTSGSTGRPKGVILSHKNIMSSLYGYLDEFQFAEDDIMLAYLPLAHVMELIAETMIILCGGAIGYSSPLTLTDRSSKVKRGSLGDATVLRPTAIISVPLINERLFKSIQENIQSSSKLFRSIFKFLIDYKLKWTDSGYSTPILDSVFFKRKMASILGGKIKYFIGGGAALATETHAFIRAVFCCPIYHGYGLTETCASACIMSQTDRSTGSSGIPTTCSSIKLVNWEAGNYSVSGHPHPRGEIHVGGEIVAQGYYKQPELSAQDFYEENGKQWFRTGDIGEMPFATGKLRIIDRKKDLIKNQFGEYIALGKIESTLKTCPLIDNICVFADSMQFYAVALVSPNVEKLTLEAEKLDTEDTEKKRLNINEEDWAQLCSNPSLEKVVMDQIRKHPSVRTGQLRKFEIPQKIRIVPEAWTPQNNLVTAGFKIRRMNVYEKYRSLINEMYVD